MLSFSYRTELDYRKSGVDQVARNGQLREKVFSKQKPGSISPTKKEHVVIAVHGIMTFGTWQERLTALIKAVDPGIRVCRFKCGFYSLLAYLFPPTRWLATAYFHRKLRKTLARHPGSRTDIVAHSFGTHLLGWGLLRFPEHQRPKLDTIILAGSVLSSGFDWGDLVHAGTVRRVFNECAARDWVVALNQLVVPFTGASGILGFNKGMAPEELRENWYDFGHGGYFKESGQATDWYMKKRWLPIITSEDTPPAVDQFRTKWYAGLLTFFLQFATFGKVVLWGCILFYAGGSLIHLYQERQTARQVALARQLAAEAGALINDQASYPELSALLSVESMRRSPSLESDHALRRALPFLTRGIPATAPSAGDVADIFKAIRTGAGVDIGMSEATPLDAGTRQQFLQLDGQLDNLATQSASVKIAKFDASVAHLVSLSSDGLHVATGSDDGVVRVFDAITGRQELQYAYGARVTALALSPGGRYVVAGYSDGALRLTRVLGDEDVASSHSDSSVDSAEFSGDGDHLIAADHAGAVSVFSVPSGNLVSRHKFDGQRYVTSASAVSFDGRCLAIESPNGITEFNTSTWEELANLSPKYRAFSRPAFSRSGRYLAAVGARGRIQIFDTSTGTVLLELSHMPEDAEFTSFSATLSFSSDGKYLANANTDGSISLYDLSSGAEISNLIDEDIVRVSFGTDPPFAYGVNLDQLAARRRGLGQVGALAFTSGDRYLIAAYTFSEAGKQRNGMRVLIDQETLLSRYLIRSADLVTEACSRLKQNLAPDEWKQYLGNEPYRETCPNRP
jgi:WD40 repeat protein